MIHPDRASMAVAMYQAGSTLKAAGAAVGWSDVAVLTHLVNRGIERRSAHRLRAPMFGIVMRRARGDLLRDIAACFGVERPTISMRLARIEARGDLSALLTLNPSQLAAYREALDTDRLTHPDALEIALEYGA